MYVSPLKCSQVALACAALLTLACSSEAQPKKIAPPPGKAQAPITQTAASAAAAATTAKTAAPATTAKTAPYAAGPGSQRKLKLDAYRKPCGQVDECVVVNGHGDCGCPDLCGDVISRSELGRFKTDLAAVDCKGFASDICKTADSCAPVTAHCVDRQCKRKRR